MRRSRVRIVSLAVLLAGAWLAAACGAIEDDPPARNPLAETPAVTASATGTASAQPSPGSSATSPAAAPALGGTAEVAAGSATEAMAGWLGVPQRELAVRQVEAVDWPDACLGVKQPLLCAQVVTAGFRVRLDDALGGTHTVHVEARSGRAVWAGETVVQATIASVDSTARRVTVQAGGPTLALRLAPGTTWFPEDGERQAAGKRVRVAYDPAAAPGTPATAAWVALEGP